MADILKLKKKAADFEAKKQADKALAVYREMIELYESGEEDPIDIPLYNRVGDLLHKAGNLPEAVTVWERAVDHYADGGFFNPAIALCNKILRQSPGRAVIYYKLGKISAEKGFRADARQNFLEYAGRMQKSGNLNEAFRALKEFADLVPDQDDVRILLAEQLVKAGRKDEAVDQLQIAYARRLDDGREDDAQELVAKMQAIDPAVEPRAGSGVSASKHGGLVFLDLDAAPPPRPRKSAGMPADLRPAVKAVDRLEILDLGIKASAAPIAPKTAPIAPKAAPPIETPAVSKTLLGLEATAFDTGSTDAVGDLRMLTDIPDIEPTSADITILDDIPAALTILDDLPAELTILDDLPAELTILDDPPAELTILDDPSAGLPMLEVPDHPQQVLDEPAETGFLEFETSDFGSFGDAEPLTRPSSVPAGFDLLQIESSEGVHSLPFIEEEPEFGDFEPEAEAPPARETSTVLAVSVDSLRDQLEDSPDDSGLRRQYAEALLDDGQRDEGIAELELSLAGYERAGDLDTAASIAEEIVRLAPKVIRYHQKRVEFAFRANDRRRLAEAYVELADALLIDGQGPKARVVYQRVLEIAPDDLRAQAALETIIDAPIPEPAPAPRRSIASAKHAPVAAAKPAPKKKKVDDDDDGFVSLGDWLREDEEPKSTRMVVEEQEPTGDEKADFDDMLRKFKQGVSANVDDEDHEAHYDLGVAYKEMGLLDEAVSEFQVVLRGTSNRARAFEALGHCFVEKGQLPVAATILQRALAEPGLGDDSLIGVLYLLGAIAEELKHFAEAHRYYQRVFAVDIRFRDVADRLRTVEQQLS